MRNRRAGQQFEQAALAAAVFPRQRDAVALPDFKRQRPADRDAVVGDGDLVEGGQPFAVIAQRRELERLGPLDILKQAGLFLDGLLLPRLDGFGALHHLGGLVADVALVRAAGLGRLHAVGPDGGARGGLL